MDKPHSFFSRERVAAVAIGVATFTCFFGPAALAQQPSKLASPYTKTAQVSLQAIESDDSVSQVSSREITQKLDATEKQASSAEEIAFAKLLRQVQQRRIQDNDLLRAYGKLIEVENAIDDSESIFVKRQKESELSQLADGEEDIMRREVGCFKELEQSLAQRSFEDAPACSQWIQKSRISHQDTLARQ